MKLFTKRLSLRKDSRGFSIVELLCAVGILAAISTAIGGAMVVSTNSYKKGSEEIALQQDSQFTANMIENLIVDATGTVEFDSTTKTLKINNVTETHVVYLDATDNTLKYTCTPVGGSTGAATVLAKNVEDFAVNDLFFDTSRNAQIMIKLKSSGSERTLSTVYNVTSRNNPGSSTAVAVTRGGSFSCITELVLEPNQTDYVVNVVSTSFGGATNGFSCYVMDTTDLTTTAVADDSNGLIKISVGANELGNVGGAFVVRIVSDDVDHTGDHWEKFITVKVRRVLDIATTCTLLTASDTATKAGAEYQITATPTGTFLDRVWGVEYDDDYKDTSGITWSYEVSDGSAWTDYIEPIGEEIANNPYTRFKLKQDIPFGEKILITATARHDKGIVSGVQTNKSGVAYDNKYKTVSITASPFYLGSAFQRGDDFVDLHENIDWEAIKAQYGGNQVFRYVRYAPAELNANGEVIAITGAWSEDILLGDTSNPGFVPIRPNELNLHPNVDYALEVIVRYGYSESDITWPVDGDSIANTFRFGVPCATIRFNYVDANGARVNFPSGTVGISRDMGLVCTKDTMYYFNVTADAGHMAKFFNDNMTYSLQRYAGSEWADVTTEWGFMFPDQMKLKAPGTPGQYRLILKWKESAWKSDLWGAYNLDSSSYANEDNNKGYVYFEVVG